MVTGGLPVSNLKFHQTFTRKESPAVSEIEVIRFHRSTEPLFRVVYAPSAERRRRELPVVGVVLTKIQALDCFSPVTSYRLEPVSFLGLT